MATTFELDRNAQTLTIRSEDIAHLESIKALHEVWQDTNRILADKLLAALPAAVDAAENDSDIVLPVPTETDEDGQTIDVLTSDDETDELNES